MALLLLRDNLYYMTPPLKSTLCLHRRPRSGLLVSVVRTARRPGAYFKVLLYVSCPIENRQASGGKQSTFVYRRQGFNFCNHWHTSRLPNLPFIHASRARL